MMPLDYPTDRAVIEAALPTIGLVEPPDAKILWIRNTLELGEVECSAAYLGRSPAARGSGDSRRAAAVAVRRRGQSAARRRAGAGGPLVAAPGAIRA